MASRTIEVVRTYFEMRAPTDLRPSAPPPHPHEVVVVRDASPSTYRALYERVGGAYHWVDRLPWTDDAYAQRYARSDVSFSLLRVDGAEAGYFELERHPDESVEIAYIGLLPGFLGRGLGGFLLTRAVETAWSKRPPRVWVHTCTLDDPAAVPNYLRRGFRAYRQERYTTVLGAHERDPLPSPELSLR